MGARISFSAHAFEVDGDQTMRAGDLAKYRAILAAVIATCAASPHAAGAQRHAVVWFFGGLG